jgi:hypothetical protein
MRTHLLFITILTVALFSAIDTNAQSTMYPDSQPGQKGDPFDITRIMNHWAHCEGETKDGGKVYRGNLEAYGAASQPTVLSDCEQIEFHGDAYNGSYSFEYGEITVNGYYRSFTKTGSYIIDQDNNLLLTLASGAKLLVLTDQLMEGILVIREVAK